jgi:endogenous inhibitor of DNA gyrase (YacG/DUF329 family)
MPRPHDPSKHAETICPTCGKVFGYYLSWPRKYCSKECAGKATVTNTGRPANNRYTTHCEMCGKAFETVPSQPGRFCSRTCFGAWKSKHQIGAANPLHGRKFDRPKNLVTLTCPVCQQPFSVKASHAARRRFCSKACQGADLAMQWAGENNPGWTGGYEPYYGPTWRPAMRLVRLRDKVCRDCGISPKELGRQLDVHHRTPFKEFGLARHAEANDPDNLIALCNTCHLKEEWRENRRAK